MPALGDTKPELPEADQTQAASEQLEESKDEIRPPSPQTWQIESRESQSAP